TAGGASLSPRTQNHLDLPDDRRSQRERALLRGHLPVAPRAGPRAAALHDSPSTVLAFAYQHSAKERDVIETITILGGHGKSGEPEPVERLDLQMGNVASIVGPTGSGKTTLINDIEMFAERDTPSGRTILINGKPAPEEYRNDPSRNPIALITQHTTFLSDLPVGEFLEIHARVRSEGGKHAASMIADTI